MKLRYLEIALLVAIFVAVIYVAALLTFQSPDPIQKDLSVKPCLLDYCLEPFGNDVIMSSKNDELRYVSNDAGRLITQVMKNDAGFYFYNGSYPISTSIDVKYNMTFRSERLDCKREPIIEFLPESTMRDGVILLHDNARLYTPYLVFDKHDVRILGDGEGYCTAR